MESRGRECKSIAAEKLLYRSEKPFRKLVDLQKKGAGGTISAALKPICKNIAGVLTGIAAKKDRIAEIFIFASGQNTQI